MKLFRKVLFWCHLAAGVVAGVVILIMSVTGVLLAYEKQIAAWADTRGYTVVPPEAGARPSLETVLARVREVEPSKPSGVTVRSDPSAPVQVSFGRQRSLYANPYTGEVLGEGAPGVRKFFRGVTDVHRWLAAPDASRPWGKAITGACNLAFLFLVVSGFYLWWPRRWNPASLRGALFFRRGLSGRARDFNWHNVIGFWSAVPLFIVVLSATVISYPWASNLVYRLAGEKPPVRRGGGEAARFGGAPGAPDAPGSHGPGGQEGTRGRGTGARPDAVPAAGEPTPDALPVQGQVIDHLLAKAEGTVSGWRTITFQLPEKAEAPVVFTIDTGTGGQPQTRTKLTLQAGTGEVVSVEPFSGGSLGTRIRSILRFAHTGEVGGLFGQTLAGLASAGGAFLVFTGLALSWRRWRSWRGRRGGNGASREQDPEISDAEIAVSGKI